MNAATVPSREDTQRRLDVLSAAVLRHTPEQTLTVTDRFEALAAAHPERTFLVWDDCAISYGEANRAMNRHAHFARAQGLAPAPAAALLKTWFARIRVTGRRVNGTTCGAAGGCEA